MKFHLEKITNIWSQLTQRHYGRLCVKTNLRIEFSNLRTCKSNAISKSYYHLTLTPFWWHRRELDQRINPKIEISNLESREISSSLESYIKLLQRRTTPADITNSLCVLYFLPRPPLLLRMKEHGLVVSLNFKKRY